MNFILPEFIIPTKIADMEGIRPRRQRSFPPPTGGTELPGPFLTPLSGLPMTPPDPATGRPTPTRRSKAAWALALLGLAPLAGWGCSDDGRVKVYPVSGKVTVQGEVPDGALVVFNPAQPIAGDLHPSAKVGADGTFKLTTYEADDGAPAGDYLVTVQWNKLVKKGNDYSAGPNAVPPAYATKEKTPWKVTVAPSANDIPPQAITK